jgi:tetratricopeptide (TPR) repeat protein
VRAQNLAGVILLEMGALDTARLRLEDALESAAGEGMDKVRADAATNLGVLHDMREQPGRAAEWYRVARAVYHQLGDTLGEARILHNLGIAHQALKSWDEADGCFARAAELAQSAGEQQLFAFAVVARGEVALMRGELAAAERFARQALIRFDCHSTLYGLAEVRKLLGMVRGPAATSRPPAAELDSAVALCEMSSRPLVDAEVRVERAAPPGVGRGGGRPARTWKPPPAPSTPSRPARAAGRAPSCAVRAARAARVRLKRNTRSHRGMWGRRVPSQTSSFLSASSASLRELFSRLLAVRRFRPHFGGAFGAVVDGDAPRAQQTLAVLHVLLPRAAAGVQRDLHPFAAAGALHGGR